MKDETVLREIAREAIAKGALPSRPPQQTWGGPGTGVKCALCHARVKNDELEFEVEFGRERYHLHLACFSAWDAERKAQIKPGIAVKAESPLDASAGAGQASASLSNDESRVLPERRSDGKIIDHGGERAYKPGAA